MKKICFAISLLLITTSAFAAPKIRGTSEALKPPGTETIPLFVNVSTLGPGTEFDTGFLPDQAQWDVIPFGTMTTLGFEVTVDGSTVKGASFGTCEANSFYPLSRMDQDSDPRSRNIHEKPYECIRGNFRSKTGDGGVSVRITPRGN